MLIRPIFCVSSFPAKCMSHDNRCTKDFPKEFIAFTAENDNGYPLYRRRKPSDGGQEVEYRMPGGGVEMVDNSWVVPWNPYLLLKCASNHVSHAAAGLSRRRQCAATTIFLTACRVAAEPQVPLSYQR